MKAAVGILGTGIYPFGRHAATADEMAIQATIQALKEAQTSLRDIDEVILGSAFGTNLASTIGTALALPHRVPITRVEVACASASTALRMGCDAIESHRASKVLVLGVDKMPGGLLQLEEAPTYQRYLGLDTFPLLYGLKANQYLSTYGYHPADLARLTATIHEAASAAPHAVGHETYTAEQVLNSPLISDPLTRLQCTRNVDGAAAAILGKPTKDPETSVQITAYVSGTAMDDPLKPMHAGFDAREWAVEELAARLYEDAGLGPEDIEIAQLNDAFSVALPLYVEALGMAEKGAGLQACLEESPAGLMRRTNTDGGLIGRGHCLGATGLAMLYELQQQMLGACKGRSLDRPPRTALLQSHGAGGENLFTLST